MPLPIERVTAIAAECYRDHIAHHALYENDGENIQQAVIEAIGKALVEAEKVKRSGDVTRLNLKRRLSAYAVRDFGLPYFEVSGGPLATPLSAGWHIIDEHGHTVAVSSSSEFAADLNDLYSFVEWLKKVDGAYLLDEDYDDGRMDIAPKDWEEKFGPMVKRILGK